MRRRDFMITLGTTAGSMSLAAQSALGSQPGAPGRKPPAVVMGAFVYPSTKSLDKVGYYSWPGSGFNAEARQAEYMGRIRKIEEKLGMQIRMEEKPLEDEAGVTQFIQSAQKAQPDGLLLILFKKGHWDHVMRIQKEIRKPTVILASLGILLVDHIRQVHETPGIYLINALDDLDAVETGMNAIRTAQWMRLSRIINIVKKEAPTTNVPNLGTEIRTISIDRFAEIFQRTETGGPVRELADRYLKNAIRIEEPTDADVLEAAKTYFVFKQILEEEQGDAVMMDCLSGISKPPKHVPPCMGFMSLRDEGIAAGCQADLNPTLTMMLIQQLFNRPSFQQNASMDTENNLYFGAHCTCPTKLFGTDLPAEPYILRNHAEAGWGCVPRVLWRPGEEVTMALYQSSETPSMMIYSGKVMSCPSVPPTGGCRTNLKMTINEVEDVCDVKGMHQCIFYGNYTKQLKTFCQLFNIQVVV